jgi:hypothetical protein
LVKNVDKSSKYNVNIIESVFIVNNILRVELLKDCFCYIKKTAPVSEAVFMKCNYNAGNPV